MKKRIVSLLLSLAMAATMGTPLQVLAVSSGVAADLAAESTAYAAESEENAYDSADPVMVPGPEVSCSNQAALVSALANASKDASAPTVITITGNFSIDGQIVVTEGSYVTLQSASASAVKTLKAVSTYPNNDNSGMLLVKGSLTLQNLILDADYKGRVMVVAPSAQLTLNSGAVIQNGADSGFNTSKGCGIYLQDGSSSIHSDLIMNSGAKISGCQYRGTGYRWEGAGIGLYVGRYASFTMTGGEISNNVDVGSGARNTPAASGGGIYVQNFAFATISGGKITKNSARYGGGGIYINGGTLSSQVLVTGQALISENNLEYQNDDTEFSSMNGAGICNFGGILTLDGSASIENNHIVSGDLDNYSGCGAGLFQSGGEFHMNGGSIKNNVAEFRYHNNGLENDHLYTEGCGGGIFLRTGKCIINGGSITGNQAKSNFAQNKYSGHGGGICISFDHDPNLNLLSECYLQGGRISSNTAQGNGADLYLMNEMYYFKRTTKLGVIDGVFPSGKNSLLSVSGNPVADEIYLPGLPAEATGAKAATITINGKLQADAALGLKLADPSLGRIVAEAAETYQLRNTDLNVLRVLDQGTAAALGIEDGNHVVLENSGSQKTSLAAAKISISNVTFNGQKQTPDPVVTLNGVTLVKGTDYAVAYENNRNAGTATVIVNGRGKYSDTAESSFVIQPLSISSSKVIAERVGDKYVTGSAIKPLPVLTYEGTALLGLEEGSEGSCDFVYSYGNNTAAGNGSIILKGQGNYSGTRTLSFNIKNANGKVVHNEAELLAALGENTGTEASPANVILANDIVMNSLCQLGEHFNGILSGNGYTITMGTKKQPTASDPTLAMFMLKGSAGLRLDDVKVDGNGNARIFYVASGCKLTGLAKAELIRGKGAVINNPVLGGQSIYNEGTVIWSGRILSATSGYYGQIYNAGSFTLEAGSLLEDLKTSNGGAIYNTGTFLMNGGSISHPIGGSTLASAISNLGSFTMKDGLITGSNCGYPAVHNEGSFTMNGGSIQGNNNTQANNLGVSGGTVFQKQGTFVMTGGKISENTAVEGGGVLVLDGSFLMNGDLASIDHNQALYQIRSTMWQVEDYGNGGGIFLDGGSFTLEKGSISGNSAGFVAAAGKEPANNGYGGAVYINGGSLKVKGGSIRDNTAYVENTEGIFFGNQSIGATSDSPAMSLSGSPVIADPIYLVEKKSITIDGTLNCGQIKVMQEGLQYNTVMAVYTDKSYAKQTDGDCFVSLIPGKSYEYNGNGQITASRLDLASCQASLVKSSYVYTGRGILPDVTVTDPDGNEVHNYVLQGSDNVNCGTATVKILGDGYASRGELSLTFKIIPKPLTDKNVSIKDVNQVYSGQPLTPAVVVKNNTITLVKDVDYLLEYKDNIDGDNGDHTGVAVVTGIGNYSGYANAYFNIKSKASIGINSTASVACGKTLTLKPVVKVGEASGAVFTYASSKSSVLKVSSKGVITALSAGTATVTVTLKESEAYYAAKASVKVNVTQGTQTISGVSKSMTRTYSTTAWTLSPKTSGDGSFKFSSSNTGVASVGATSGKVTMKGYGQAIITITASETSNYKKATLKITLNVNPKTMTVKSISSPSAGKVKVGWSKDSKVSGYQIQYSYSSKMTNARTKLVSGASKLSYTLSGLSKGKTCYVQIRGYKMVGSKALVGKWSKTRSVKVK